MNPNRLELYSNSFSWDTAWFTWWSCCPSCTFKAFICMVKHYSSIRQRSSFFSRSCPTCWLFRYVWHVQPMVKMFSFAFQFSANRFTFCTWEEAFDLWPHLCSLYTKWSQLTLCALWSSASFSFRDIRKVSLIELSLQRFTFSSSYF